MLCVYDEFREVRCAIIRTVEIPVSAHDFLPRMVAFSKVILCGRLLLMGASSLR